MFFYLFLNDQKLIIGKTQSSQENLEGVPVDPTTYEAAVVDESFFINGSLVLLGDKPKYGGIPTPDGWIEDQIQKMNSFRYERNKKLIASDVVVFRCYEKGIPVPPEWVSYRQALRDLTNQDVDLVQWPKEPLLPDFEG